MSRRISSPSRTSAERTAHRRFGRHVQHHGSPGGPAHPRVRHPDHVPDPGREELLRDRERAGFGHPGPAHGPGVLEDEDARRRDGQRRIVDPGREVREVPEHAGAAAVAEEGRRGGRHLEHGAVGGEAPAENGEPALRLERPVEGRDHVLPGARGPARRPARRRACARSPSARPGGAAGRAPSSRPGCRPPRRGPPCGTYPTAGCWPPSGWCGRTGRSRRGPSGDAGPSGDRRQVDDDVGRAADRHEDPHRVLERRAGRGSGRAGGPPATISTIRRPAASARRSRRESGAGMAAMPGRVIPRASVIAAIVLAVPMTMQVPVEGKSSPWIASMRSASISPARCSVQSRRQSVHAPSRIPS